MNHTFSRVAVIGAGTMGSRIAALFANADIDVDLLDIVPDGSSKDARSAIAQAAVDLMRSAKARAPLYTASAGDRIRVGNLEDHSDRIGEADWIVEAIVERLDAKRDLHRLIDDHRKQGAVVSSNTSGIPIQAIGEGRSDDFRSRLLGTHFFNPPRYTRLLEIIPTSDTDSQALESVTAFSETVLGKGVVVCKDTANFIGNRIGIFVIADAIREMVQTGLTIDDVDAITGPALGRPRSGTFRLADLVGIDILADVAGNLPGEDGALPDFVSHLGEQGRLGDKAGVGFYEKRKSGSGSEIWTLDWRTGEYAHRKNVEWESLDAVRRVREAAERIQSLVNHADEAARFAWRHLSSVLGYAAACIPEISDDLQSVDQAMRWGFNWELGPFELWDAIGVSSAADRMASDGQDPPQLVQDLLDSGAHTFYREGTDGPSLFVPHTKSHAPQRTPDAHIDLARLKAQGSTILSNEGANLVDLGDGVACLDFGTKMNIIDESVEALYSESLDEVERNFAGLVVGNHAEHFSLGANLVWMLETAKARDWKALDTFLVDLQQPCVRARTLSRPVVVAPTGMALGGGAEIVLGAGHACAGAETNIGLVEVNVGLIPAGGGTCEMAHRCQEGTEGNEEVLQKRLERTFRQIVTSRVSDNAYEARDLGYLRSTDRIAANPDRHLYEARRMVLDLSNDYSTPGEREIFVLGASGIDHLRAVAREMRDEGKLTEYDVFIADELANVLCGGPLPNAQTVDDDHLLDLEREAFLRLFDQSKTHDRISHTLKTGKPLRN